MSNEKDHPTTPDNTAADITHMTHQDDELKELDWTMEYVSKVSGLPTSDIDLQDIRYNIEQLIHNREAKAEQRGRIAEVRKTQMYIPDSEYGYYFKKRIKDLAQSEKEGREV